MAVTTMLEPGPSPDRPYLRLRSSRVVQEPVLHVRLQVGCDGSTTREFVLLADPPPLPATVSPVSPLASAEPVAVAAATGAGAANTQPLRDAEGAGAATRSPAVTSRVPGARREAAVAPAVRAPRPVRPAPVRAVPQRARPAPAKAPLNASVPAAAKPLPAPLAEKPSAPVLPAAPVASAPQTAPSVSSTGGRLQLDALEPLPPREAAAPSVSSLAVPAAGAVGAGAVAGAAGSATDAGVSSAAGWGASGTPNAGEPYSATLAEIERTKQMEAALAELRTQARQNQQTLLELRSELAQARERTYSNWLVYGLLLLLVLAAVALWVLWRSARTSPASPWAADLPQEPRVSFRQRMADRRRHKQVEEDEDDEEDAFESMQAPSYFSATTAATGAPGSHPAQLSDFDDLSSAPGLSDTRLASLPQRGVLARVLPVEELFDVQQQADFFNSLGQNDQAIEVLRHYISEHPKTSPLAYWELLYLYHQLKREGDYEELRLQCEQRLGVQLPDFEAFGEGSGRALQHYPGAYARLKESWPEAQTLEVIEALLFNQEEAGEGVLDLPAYRELLMLYGVLQESQFGDGEVWPELEGLLRLPRSMGSAPTYVPDRFAVEDQPTTIGELTVDQPQPDPFASTYRGTMDDESRSDRPLETKEEPERPSARVLAFAPSNETMPQPLMESLFDTMLAPVEPLEPILDLNQPSSTLSMSLVPRSSSPAALRAEGRAAADGPNDGSELDAPALSRP